MTGGKQPDGRKMDPPSWVQGTEKRFSKEAASWVPAPGHYGKEEFNGRVAPGVGRQITSDKRQAPQFGFGSGTRDHREKVYIRQ